MRFRAHYKKAGTKLEKPGFEAKGILEYAIFSTWNECAASGCRCFMSECKQERTSLTRKSRTPFSLVPNIFKTSVLPLEFIVYLMAALAAGWMGPAAAHWGKHYSLQCIESWSRGWCSGFSSTGSVDSTSLWLWELESSNMASLQVLLMHLPGTGGWVSLYYLPYRVKESVVHAALVYQYFFHVQNLNAPNHCQTSCWGNLMLIVSEQDTQSCLVFQTWKVIFWGAM